MMDSVLENFPDRYTLSGIEAQAVAYAREAGRLAMAHYRKPLDITYKSKRMGNPVTEADKDIEAFLHAAIARDFSGHGILGEEGTGISAKDSDFWWVLDPLDGTRNFVNGLPFFAVSIGVLYKRQPVAAAIFAPETHFGSQGIFHASKGAGAYLDEVQLHVADEDTPSPARLVSVPGAYGGRFKMDRELRRRHGEPRVMGSIALELALTAGAVFQFAVFGGPKIWDVAAGLLIAREAGGTVLARCPESGEWETMENFTPTEADQADEADALRKWVRPIIVGNPGVAGFVAQHLTLRTRSGAKARSGSSQAVGIAASA